MTTRQPREITRTVGGGVVVLGVWGGGGGGLGGWLGHQTQEKENPVLTEGKSEAERNGK